MPGIPYMADLDSMRFWAEDVGYPLKALLPNSNIHKGTCDPSVKTREEQAWEQQALIILSKSLSLLQLLALAVLTQCWVQG